VLSIAGLWHEWREGNSFLRLLSCTLIVTDANLLAALMTACRLFLAMKVFLRGSTVPPVPSFSVWSPENLLQTWLVSRGVNRSAEGVDEPTVLDPIELSALRRGDPGSLVLSKSQKRGRKSDKTARRSFLKACRPQSTDLIP
jgi:hypothetical protein